MGYDIKIAHIYLQLRKLKVVASVSSFFFIMLASKLLLLTVAAASVGPSQSVTVVNILDYLVDSLDDGQGEPVVPPLMETPTPEALAGLSLDELNSLLDDNPVMVLGEAFTNESLPSLS